MESDNNSKQEDLKMDKYLIVGLGVFGKELARNLIEMGKEVIAIDRRLDLIEEIQDEVTLALKLDSTDERALQSIGADEIDVAIVCIGEHFESNLLTAVNLKHLGTKKVIARASDSIQERILKAVNVDMVISPEVEAADKLSYQLVYKGMIDVSYIGGDTIMAKVVTPASFENKNLQEIQLRAKFSLNLVSVHTPRTDDNGRKLPPLINNSPGADTVLKKGDILVIVGSNKNLKKLSDLD
jgi:trk system potassium uptake protein TrkA